MNKYLQEIIQANKAVPRRWSRILTNSMTIAGWKLFGSDYRLHFGFILWRLRTDFGMSYWELANFTGIPMKPLKKFFETVKPIIQSDVLQIIAKENQDTEIDEWNLIPDTGGLPQALTEDGWYNKKIAERFRGQNIGARERYGEELEKYFKDIIKNAQTKTAENDG